MEFDIAASEIYQIVNRLVVFGPLLYFTNFVTQMNYLCSLTILE